jgi:NADH-quinone oxidoreductase subunit J
MSVVFYLSAAVAVISTLFVITRLNAMHALLYLIVSLLAVAILFFTLGAPFVGMLEIIIYAGAIMVLFLFANMLLSLGPTSVAQESRLLNLRIWAGPVILAVLLLGELIYVLTGSKLTTGINYIDPTQVGVALYGPYLLGVELASFLLLSGLIGAYHLGRRNIARRELGETSEASESLVGSPAVQVWPEPEKSAEQEHAPVFQPGYTGEDPAVENRGEGGKD